MARAWMSFAKSLEKINTTFLLTAIFYLVLTPTALLYRWFDKKTSNHFFRKKNSSYFNDLEPNTKKESFERPW